MECMNCSQKGRAPFCHSVGSTIIGLDRALVLKNPLLARASRLLVGGCLLLSQTHRPASNTFGLRRVLLFAPVGVGIRAEWSRLVNRASPPFFNAPARAMFAFLGEWVIVAPTRKH